MVYMIWPATCGQWASDLYASDYYASVNNNKGIHNPKGPNKSFDPRDIYNSKRVIRGGSYLCNDSYCSGYRVAARMKTSTRYKHGTYWLSMCEKLVGCRSRLL